MRKFINKIISFIFISLAFAILFITFYMCMELFEIIQVPEEYSLIKFLYSKMEVISSVQDYVQNKQEDKDFDDILNNTNSITVELPGNSVTTIHLQNEDGIEHSNTSGQEYFRYYDQLDENAKKMYDALKRDKDLLKTGTHKVDFGTEFSDYLNQENGSESLNNSFQLAVNAFAFDHPEIFYIDITKMYLLTEITTRPFSKTYKVAIGPNETDYLFEEYQSQTDVENAINQIETIKEYIKNNAVGNSYEKIKYIHDYLIETTEYEKETKNHNNYNIYGTFINKKAVCEGYAKSLKYILDDMQIPSIIVCGVAKNSAGQTESHAWNYVYIDNNWYAVDVTWDDPIIIGNGWVSESVKYKYFMKGSNTFFTDHAEDGTIVKDKIFVYPTLNSNDY